MTLRLGALLASAVVVAVLAVAMIRERSTGEAAVAAAAADAATADWVSTIAQARAAAEAVAPGSPWPDEGFRRLEAVGHDAEARIDSRTALLAYGAMRSAADASSSRVRWRELAQEGLARASRSEGSGRAP